MLGLLLYSTIYAGSTFSHEEKKHGHNEKYASLFNGGILYDYQLQQEHLVVQEDAAAVSAYTPGTLMH